MGLHKIGIKRVECKYVPQRAKQVLVVLGRTIDLYFITLFFIRQKQKPFFEHNEHPLKAYPLEDIFKDDLYGFPLVSLLFVFFLVIKAMNRFCINTQMNIRKKIIKINSKII